MRTANRVLTTFLLVSFFISSFCPLPSLAQNGQRTKTNTAKASVDGPDTAPVSEMRAAIERYTVDRGSLSRSYTVNYSANRRDRFRKFYSDWLASLQKLDFDSMSQDGKIDYLLFKNHLEYELRQLDIQARQISEIEPLMPFAKTIADLEEARRRMEPVDSAKVAALLTSLKKQVDDKRRQIEMGLRPEGRGGMSPAAGDGAAEPLRVKKTVGNRAVIALNNVRGTLRNWYTFYNGYDPVFTWWNEEPYRALEQSISGYATFLTERVLGLRTEGSQTAGGPQAGGGGGGQRGG